MKAALALLVLAVVGTAIGIAARLPYQFGGIGEPSRVGEDFVTRGTAVSPPVVALVILAIAIVIAMQRGLVGRLGSALLAILAAVFFIPTLGEITGAGAFSGATQVFVIVWALIGLAILVLMLWSGAREAIRGQPSTPSA